MLLSRTCARPKSSSFFGVSLSLKNCLSSLFRSRALLDDDDDDDDDLGRRRSSSLSVVLRMMLFCPDLLFPHKVLSIKLSCCSLRWTIYHRITPGRVVHHERRRRRRRERGRERERATATPHVLPPVTTPIAWRLFCVQKRMGRSTPCNAATTSSSSSSSSSATRTQTLEEFANALCEKRREQQRARPLAVEVYIDFVFPTPKTLVRVSGVTVFSHARVCVLLTNALSLSHSPPRANHRRYTDGRKTRDCTY